MVASSKNKAKKMASRNEIAQQLYQSRRMLTQEEFENFENARIALFETEDPAILSDLFSALDDSTHQSEVMWGLIHDIEAFDPRIYIRKMLEATPKMLLHAREWLTVLHMRLFNSPEITSIYRDTWTTLADEDKETIQDFLRRLKQPDSKLRQQIDSFLNESE